MSERNDSKVAEDVSWQILHWVLICLAFALFAVSGAFLLSVLLVKLVFWLVNQMTEGEIDRNEAIGLLISAVLFGALALLLLPYAMEAGLPWEQAVGWLMAGGAVWGLAVGYKVLLDWWHELEKTALPAAHFSQSLNLPEQPYLPSGGANP